MTRATATVHRTSPGAQSRPGGFVLDLTPSPDDIDELGHVSNIVYVGWLQKAAVAHAHSLGYDCEVFRKFGGVFVVRRHEIDYRQQAYAGQSLQIESWIESWRPASAIRKTVIRRASDGAVVAGGSTLWAFVNLETGRPCRIPAQIRAAFCTGSTCPQPKLHVVDGARACSPVPSRSSQNRAPWRRSIGPKPAAIPSLPWLSGADGGLPRGHGNARP